MNVFYTLIRYGEKLFFDKMKTSAKFDILVAFSRFDEMIRSIFDALMLPHMRKREKKLVLKKVHPTGYQHSL